MFGKLLMTAAVALPLAAPAYAEDHWSKKYPFSADDQAVEDFFVKSIGRSRASVHMSIIWDKCTEGAVDRFSMQQETARAIAEAAMAACSVEEAEYMIASGIQSPEPIRETSLPGLMARVMENRAKAALGSKSR